MNPHDRLRSARLLLVTDPRPDLAARVEAALRGGVDVVQLRDKHASREELLPLAGKLRDLCERSGALFTVNDDVELARLSGAHGVHLGQEDGPLAPAREALGVGAVIGRSAGTLHEALEGVREGADYLGIGTIYGTPTKTDGTVSGLDLVREVVREGPPVPVFAIGGITLETAPEVARAAAEAAAEASYVFGFAVVRALLDAEDPEAAARKLRSYLPGVSAA
jgi:thiamine-phosphate pyrophosphorylase